MAQQESQDSIKIQGELHGHSDWVTCIATAADSPNMLVSGSRDKSIVVWELETKTEESDGQEEKVTIVGNMKKRLVGHNHFISDISVSSDKQYCLSSSWDGTLRLWNLKTGETKKRFVGHKKDVLSVAFSADNRHIVSGARDRDVCVWNTIAVLKKKALDTHTDWVTCVRCSPNADEPVIVSASRDATVKVWDVGHDQDDPNQQMRLKHDLRHHTSYVNSVTVSPDGSLCASGGKDGLAILWDLTEGKMLSALEANGEIYALCFSPNRYWLCGAVKEFSVSADTSASSIKIWDLETKEEIGRLKLPEQEQTQEEQQNQRQKKKKRKKNPILCTCLTWSHDGKTLFAGYTDKTIRVWTLISGSEDQY